MTRLPPVTDTWDGRYSWRSLLNGPGVLGSQVRHLTVSSAAPSNSSLQVGVQPGGAASTEGDSDDAVHADAASAKWVSNVAQRGRSRWSRMKFRQPAMR